MAARQALLCNAWRVRSPCGGASCARPNARRIVECRGGSTSYVIVKATECASRFLQDAAINVGTQFAACEQLGYISITSLAACSTAALAFDSSAPVSTGPLTGGADQQAAA